MPKLLITFKDSSKLKDNNKFDSQFRYDSNMSGFSDLDNGIKFNFLVISLVSLFPSQGAHQVLTIFYHFHGHMTTSTNFSSHIQCASIVSSSHVLRTGRR